MRTYDGNIHEIIVVSTLGGVIRYIDSALAQYYSKNSPLRPRLTYETIYALLHIWFNGGKMPYAKFNEFMQKHLPTLRKYYTRVYNIIRTIGFKIKYNRDSKMTFVSFSFALRDLQKINPRLLAPEGWPLNLVAIPDRLLSLLMENRPAHTAAQLISLICLLSADTKHMPKSQDFLSALLRLSVPTIRRLLSTLSNNKIIRIIPTYHYVKKRFVNRGQYYKKSHCSDFVYIPSANRYIPTDDIRTYPLPPAEWKALPLHIRYTRSYSKTIQQQQLFKIDKLYKNHIIHQLSDDPDPSNEAYLSIWYIRPTTSSHYSTSTTWSLNQQFKNKLRTIKYVAQRQKKRKLYRFGSIMKAVDILVSHRITPEKLKSLTKCRNLPLLHAVALSLITLLKDKRTRQNIFIKDDIRRIVQLYVSYIKKDKLIITTLPDKPSVPILLDKRRKTQHYTLLCSTAKLIFNMANKLGIKVQRYPELSTFTSFRYIETLVKIHTTLLYLLQKFGYIRERVGIIEDRREKLRGIPRWDRRGDKKTYGPDRMNSPPDLRWGVQDVRFVDMARGLTYRRDV